MKNFAVQNNFKIATILILTLFLSTASFAQEVKIFDYKTLLSTNEKIEGQNNDMQNLVSALLPSISISNGVIEFPQNEVAISIISDPVSFSKIASIENGVSNIEILKIQLSNESDLSNTFNLSTLNNLSALKYIYIICPFDVNTTQVSQLLTGTSPAIVIYTAAIPR